MLSFHRASHFASSAFVASQKNRSFAEEVNTTIISAQLWKQSQQERWKFRLFTWRKGQMGLMEEVGGGDGGGAVYRQQEQKSMASFWFSWNGRGWIADRRYRFRVHNQPKPNGTHRSILVDGAFQNTLLFVTSQKLVILLARVLLMYYFSFLLPTLSFHPPYYYHLRSSIPFNKSFIPRSYHHHHNRCRHHHREPPLPKIEKKSWSIYICASAQYPIPQVRFILQQTPILPLFPHFRPATPLDYFSRFLLSSLEMLDGYLGYCNTPSVPHTTTPCPVLPPSQTFERHTIHRRSPSHFLCILLYTFYTLWETPFHWNFEVLPCSRSYVYP